MIFLEILNYTVGAMGIIVGGVFAFMSVYSKARKTVQEEINAESKILAELLKGQVDVLEREVRKMAIESSENNSEIKILKIKIEELIKENTLLRTLLENRDEEGKVYRKNVLDSIKRNNELLETTSRTEVKVDEVKVVTQETKDIVQSNGR